MRKRYLGGLISAGGMLLLILDSETALKGASVGILICINSIIPSIFPFLVLSGILISYLSNASSKSLQYPERLMKLPMGTAYLFMIGLLGGYPTGAECVHSAYEQGQISQKAASRMLPFCSNAGPAFIFGMLSSQFEFSWLLWMLWGLQFLSAMLTGILLPGKYSQAEKASPCEPITMVQSLRKSVGTMGCICGWIVIFHMAFHWLDKWLLWLLPTSVQVILTGILELANGCLQLNRITNIGLRFIVASMLLSFGGICVLMQTASVIKDLPIKIYFWGKLLQSTLSLLLSMSFQVLFFPIEMQVTIPAIIWVLLFTFILLLCMIAVYKKTVAFREQMVYNGCKASNEECHHAVS